jgi:hypothetical protein
MVSRGLMIALFIVPIAIIFMMRRKIGTNDGIPAVRGTPNCDAATHFCTCPNGESWQMGAAATCTDCTNECYDRMGIVGGLNIGVEPGSHQFPGFDPSGGATGAKSFPTNLVEGTLQFPLSEKVAIPIVGGQYDWDDEEFFGNFAHGACKCDDYECCYKAPYQAERGDVRTETSCEGVYYGDKVQACDNAFLNWQDDMFDTGIDGNDYISQKINDKRFFYNLGYNGKKHRHRESGKYTPQEYAYMGTRAHRPYSQRAFPANINNHIRGQTKSALYRVLREKTAGKRLKYTRLARKLR